MQFDSGFLGSKADDKMFNSFQFHFRYRLNTSQNVDGHNRFTEQYGINRNS